MKKYRVKISNERIVGPFSREQIGELFIKGRISGEEECQLFPAGAWKKIDQFEELSILLLGIVEKKVSLQDLKATRDSKTVVNLSIASLKKENDKPDDKKEMEEFQFSKEKPPLPVVEQEKIEESVEKNTKEVEEEDFDKTVVRPEIKAAMEAEKLEKIKKEERAKKAAEERAAQEKEAEEVKVDVDEKTEFIDLKKIKEESAEEIKDVEKEILDAELLEKQEDVDVADVTDDSSDQLDKSKRKKIIYGLVIAAMAIFVLFPEEDKKSNTPIYPKIIFPVAFEYEDGNKSVREFSQGVKAYRKGDFASKVKASQFFRKSLQYKFNKNDSLGYLILTYAEIVKDSKNVITSSKVIFDLIQLAKTKILSDVNIALGAAIFYGNLGKHKTALNIVENFLRVKGKVTPKFFSVYLDLLVKTGHYEKATKIFDKFCKGTSLPVEGFLNCTRFLILNEKKDDALSFVTVGLEKYPASVPLLLQKGGVAFQTGKHNSLLGILKKIKAVAAERSPIYYSQFLELYGVSLALSGKTDLAITYMKKALKYYDSPELRSKLSSIELDGKSDALINESRSYDLMHRSKKEFKKRNYQEALRLAIEAVDLADTNSEARRLLAQVQVKMGFVGDAIKVLVQLQADNANDVKINYELINAYLEAQRLDEAITQILTVKNSKFSKTAEYASLLAKYYSRRKNYPLAISWYQKSLKRNPLNDRDYYLFAKLLLKLKKYRESKLRLARAIELESDNVEYYSLNGKILYEVDGVDVAIGYLRKKLQDFPDDPKLLGDIAKYYYRSGKLDEFEEYKKRVEKRIDVDEDYYRFMIDAAKLEDRFDDVIRYSERLIAMSPGDIDSRMFLGEYYLTNKNIEKANKIFSEISTQLTSYPKVHYYLAKCFLAQKKYKEAYAEGEIEIKNNPSLEYGYFVAGEALKLMKKYPEAVKKMEKAVSINGQSVEALLSLGWIKHKQNYLQEARELYMRALREEPGNPTANRELGLVYQSIGQSSLAIESLKLYLDLVPKAKDKSQIELIIKKLQ